MQKWKCNRNRGLKWKTAALVDLWPHFYLYLCTRAKFKVGVKSQRDVAATKKKTRTLENGCTFEIHYGKITHWNPHYGCVAAARSG